MKLRKYIAGSLLALMALAAGCSSEEIVDNNGGGTNTPGGDASSTLVFNFAGLRLANGPLTRAETIATEDETVVENLTIILAGVDDETHTTGGAAVIYEYRSTWENEPVENDHYKKLTLTQTGNVLVGKLPVDEAVMKPEYVSKKAIVLVNGVQIEIGSQEGQNRLLNLPTDLETDAVNYEILYQLCGGKIGGYSMTDLGGSMKFKWGPADLETESIETPLPMTAMVNSINFHGSTNVDVQLIRGVSRFDLRNGQSEVLRIGSIRPLNAVTGMEETARVDMMDQDFTVGATDADWEDVPSEIAPAFYTFPSALDAGKQTMKFRVTAKKLNAESNLWEDKTYTLELQDADGKPMSIDRNTRYVINISGVTDLHITAAIVIAEWEQGGDIDGDLNVSKKSRKLPVLADFTDDAVNNITWGKDAKDVPNALAFGNAFVDQTITFTTPEEVEIIDGADTDQPKVQVDITAEVTHTRAATDEKDVWLTWTSAPGTDGNAGKTVHTLTVNKDMPAGVDYHPLWVKVKNYYFPEKFVLIKVTATPSDRIMIDVTNPDGGANSPVTVPDGLVTDPDNDSFTEGTVEVVPAP